MCAGDDDVKLKNSDPKVLFSSSSDLLQKEKLNRPNDHLFIHVLAAVLIYFRINLDS